MAPLKARKPAAVIFDLVATATKSFFIDEILFPYIKQNAKKYLVENWSNEVVQNDVTLMRKASKKDETAPKIADPNEDAGKVQESVAKYVTHCLDEKKDNEGMTLFRFHVIFDGYAKGRLETPLYTDVAVQMHHWVVEDKVKLYLFSNGWKEATKRYLAKTSKGDMNLLIADHFDTEEGQLTDPATFKKIVGKIKQAPEDVLFLTHCSQEAMAAKKAGLGAILIMTHRRDVNKLTLEEKKELPYVRSFNEIIFTGDAPKARNLNGSSVGDDDEPAGGGEGGGKKKTPSKSNIKSAKKKKKSKSKSKMSSSSAAKRKSSSSGSQTKADSATADAAELGSKSKSKVKSSAAKSSKSGEGSKSSNAVSKAGSKTSSKSADGSKAKSSAAGSKNSKMSSKSTENAKGSGGGSKGSGAVESAAASGSNAGKSIDGGKSAGGTEPASGGGSSDAKSSAAAGSGSKSEGKQ